MGTPLEDIKTERGVECSICLESGGPFPDGPTPKNPLMTLSGYSEGDLWDEAFRREIEAGLVITQDANPCHFSGFSESFAWVWNNDSGFSDVRIITLDPLGNPAFVATPGALCQVDLPDQNNLPANTVAFGGIAHLTWGEVV